MGGATLERLLTGRCLCGVVQYALSGGPETRVIVNCHCSYCRRAHGSAFVTVALMRRSRIDWTAGEALSRFRSPAGGIRFFCSECGTRLCNSPPVADGLSVAVATPDEGPPEAVVAHVNTESKAPWYEILGGLPEFAALPTGEEFAKLMAERGE